MRLLLPGSVLVSGLFLIACGSDAPAGGSVEAGTGGAPEDSGPAGTGGRAGASGAGGGKSGAGGSAGASGRGGASGADGGAGAPGADGSAGASDGGAEAGAADSGDSGRGPKAGFVGVVSRATEVATVFSNSVIAAFVDGPGNTITQGCRREVIANCATILCDFTTGGNPPPPPGAPVSAGTVTIGGTTPGFSLDYDTAAMQYVAVPKVPADKLLFAGGSTITIAAAGADVPAFAASLVAPTPIKVTSPVLAGGPLSIDASKDLVFNWNVSSAGAVAFNVRTSTSSAGASVSASFVSCQFQASALTGTIPTALLQVLEKTDATTTATLTTDLSTTKGVPAGDYMVHLALGSLVTDADGKTPYTGPVTIL